MKDITIAEARMLTDALATHHSEYDNTFDPEDEEVYNTLKADLADFLKRIEDTNNTLELWTDGAARPTNPGPAGIGIVGKVAGRTVIEVAQYIGKTSNNVAEYKAVVEALRRAIDLGASKVILYTDSKLIVTQYTGEAQCRTDTLVPLLGRVKGLASRFESFKIKWIPREKNREADGLSVAGAYQPRNCGACRHEWHTSFCLVVEENTGVACGCPHGFKGGISA